MICKCGNDTFYANQVLRCLVIVDRDNNYIENASEDGNPSIYDAGTPYGTYECTKCGAEYERLK